MGSCPLMASWTLALGGTAGISTVTEGERGPRTTELLLWVGHLAKDRPETAWLRGASAPEGRRKTTGSWGCLRSLPRGPRACQARSCLGAFAHAALRWECLPLSCLTCFLSPSHLLRCGVPARTIPRKPTTGRPSPARVFPQMPQIACLALDTQASGQQRPCGILSTWDCLGDTIRNCSTKGQLAFPRRVPTPGSGVQQVAERPSPSQVIPVLIPKGMGPGLTGSPAAANRQRMRQAQAWPSRT